jgi:hypothetical protein
VELARISIAQVAEKIDLPLAVRKELCIQFIRVETGHRSAVQSQSACGQDEVSGLQRAVAEGVLLNQRFISDEVGAHIKLRKELGKMLVKFRVPGDDNGHGSCHGFVDIAGRQNWLEERLGAWGGQKKRICRASRWHWLAQDAPIRKPCAGAPLARVREATWSGFALRGIADRGPPVRSRF